MRMTIDVWNELPFAVRTKLQIMGKMFNEGTIPKSVVEGQIITYIDALIDAEVIGQNESILLKKYVLSIGREEQA